MKRFSRIFLTVVAVSLSLIGLLLIFQPIEFEEITFLTGASSVLLQLTGSFYMGLGMFNWMNKHKLIGGIYNRPLVLTNFTHFFISVMAMAKTVDFNSAHSFELALLAYYVCGFLGFAYLMLTGPKVD